MGPVRRQALGLRSAAPTRREVVAALSDDLWAQLPGYRPRHDAAVRQHHDHQGGPPEQWAGDLERRHDRLVYHWYFFDGSEARWAGLETTLPNDVKPGETVVVPDVRIQVPDYTGPMYLTLDLKRGQNYASTGANSRGGDIFVLPVNLLGGVWRR